MISHHVLVFQTMTGLYSVCHISVRKRSQTLCLQVATVEIIDA